MGLLSTKPTTDDTEFKWWARRSLLIAAVYLIMVMHGFDEIICFFIAGFAAGLISTE